MMTARTLQPWAGELLQHESMARHTTWRVGGPARHYYRPQSLDDLAGFLATLSPDEPLFWLGLGSNLLVRDGGINGTVIATSGVLDGIERIAGERVLVECGASCARVARFCAREGLAGAEFLCGIPGTMGGALAMNAGCFGGETWRLVKRVETIDRHGIRHWREAAEFEVGYRHVQGPAGEWFLRAELQLAPGESAQLQQCNRELLARRGDSQPTRLPNAGSVFRNPPGDHAARLIETAGLKGRSLGGAQVSEKHANFIVNRGNATAAEIEGLIELVRAEVLRVHGIALQTEVCIVGEAA